MKFEYHTTNKVDTIFNEDTLDIEVTMVNASPFLFEPTIEKPNVFDLNQVDDSMRVEIGLKVF